MQKKRPDFPTFAVVLLVFFGVVLFLIMNYASKNLFSTEPSEVTITSNGQAIGWVIEKNTWRGTEYDHDSIFVNYEAAGLMPNIVTEGDEIKITMGAGIPDTVTLHEYALTSNGRSIYGERELIQELIFYFGMKSGTFTIPSNSDHPVRGYLLTCTWGENTCEYAFIAQVLPN